MSHNTNNDSGNIVLEPHPFLGYIVYSKINMEFIRGVLV